MERRQSPRVYRNRRIAAVVLLLLLIGAVWGIVAGVGAAVRALRGDVPATTASASPAPSAASSAAAGKASPAPSSSAKPSSSSAPVEYPLCYSEFLDVQMSTDKESYTGKEKPVLIMTITNVSQETCVADVGTKQMVFTLSTGSSQVFSSADCQVNPSSLLRKIEPGKSETARFTWQRNATAPGCAAPGQKITSGTYQLIGKLGEITTAPTSFDLQWEGQ